MSKVGREVMIKSVLQSIPSYIMSIFLLPNKLVDAIEKMINAFWWGHGGNMRRGLHWMFCERLSVHKNFGGMGFKDLTSFNVAMLGKQGWRFQTDSNSLVCWLFKARYFPNSDFIGSKIRHNPSYVWRSIFSAKIVVKQGARWRIGSGVNIPFLGDPWLKDGLSLSTTNPIFEPLLQVKLCDFIDQDLKMWKASLICSLFDAQTA